MCNQQMQVQIWLAKIEILIYHQALGTQLLQRMFQVERNMEPPIRMDFQYQYQSQYSFALMEI